MVERRRSERAPPLAPLPHRMSQLFFPAEGETPALHDPALHLTLRPLGTSPPIYAIDGFLSARELEHLNVLIGPSASGFRASHVDDARGSFVDVEERTSVTLQLTKAADPILRAIERRAAELLGMSPDHTEPLQLVAYSHGARFGLHHDMGTLVCADDALGGGAADALAAACAPACDEPRTPTVVDVDVVPPRRLATLFVYLNTTREGVGHTEFPLSEPPLSVRPRAGSALLWSNVARGGEPELRAAHRAAAVPHPHCKLGLNVWVTDTSLAALAGRHAPAVVRRLRQQGAPGHAARGLLRAASAAECACARCGGEGSAERMLICDGARCGAGWHTFCLQPPLQRVPEGTWLCPACAPPKAAPPPPPPPPPPPRALAAPRRAKGGAPAAKPEKSARPPAEPRPPAKPRPPAEPAPECAEHYVNCRVRKPSGAKGSIDGHIVRVLPAAPALAAAGGAGAAAALLPARLLLALASGEHLTIGVDAVRPLLLPRAAAPAPGPRTASAAHTPVPGAAPPPAACARAARVRPSLLLGRTLVRAFAPHGDFLGQVSGYDDATGWFRVQYDADGDEEDLPLPVLERALGGQLRSAGAAARLVSRRVRKAFPGYGVFDGVVLAHLAELGAFRVRYEDGDDEDVRMAELRRILLPLRAEAGGGDGGGSRAPGAEPDPARVGQGGGGGGAAASAVVAGAAAGKRRGVGDAGAPRQPARRRVSGGGASAAPSEREASWWDPSRPGGSAAGADALLAAQPADSQPGEGEGDAGSGDASGSESGASEAEASRAASGAS